MNVGLAIAPCGHEILARDQEAAQGVRQPKALEDEVLAHLRSRKCATPGHDHRLGEHDDEHEEEPRGTVPTIRQSRGSWAP